MANAADATFVVTAIVTNENYWRQNIIRPAAIIQ
jgi:hypothetical protein